MRLTKIKKAHFNYWIPIIYDAYFVHKSFYVLGYTKSGTNWLRNLIHYYYTTNSTSDNFLNDNKKLKINVFHMHRFLTSSYFKHKTIYMVRDGRDSIVSRYFTMVNQGSQIEMKNDFITFSGNIPTSENIKQLLPFYIDFLKVYNKSTIDYVTHVERAINNDFFIIRYEDLKISTKDVLVKVIRYLTPNNEVDNSIIDKSIDYCSIESAKKRQKKDTGFFRKEAGAIGGWKDYFTIESANSYNEYAGKLLVELGYETNDDWIYQFK